MHGAVSAERDRSPFLIVAHNHGENKPGELS
jgi:hypothetical protein